MSTVLLSPRVDGMYIVHIVLRVEKFYDNLNEIESDLGNYVSLFDENQPAI